MYVCAHMGSLFIVVFALAKFSELTTKADRAHVNVKNGKELNKQQRKERELDGLCVCASARL